jgi:hypothetical protein
MVDPTLDRLQQLQHLDPLLTEPPTVEGLGRAQEVGVGHEGLH